MVYEIYDDLNIVINTIMADKEFVDENYPGHYKEVIFVVRTEPSMITKLALLNRMTDAEFISIINAAKTDAEVELWKIRFDNATTIDLTSNDRVVTGFSMLVSKGLLTQERSAEILNLVIQPNER